MSLQLFLICYVFFGLSVIFVVKLLHDIRGELQKLNKREG